VQRRGILLLTLGLTTSALSLGWAPPARAQTASEIAVAKQWFSDGLAREEKGEFGPALDLFRRAAQVKRTPQIVYHVGFCESRTAALVEALVDLDSAAALARSAHASDVVAAAETELAEVKKRVPTLQVRLVGSPSRAATPARFLVDGSSIALSLLGSAMPLDPGDHSVSIELASGGVATKAVTLAERDAKVVELAPPSEAPPSRAAAVAAPLPPAILPPDATARTPEAPPAAARSSTTEWVLVGVGAAVTVVGGGLFAAARVKESSLNGACPSHLACDPSLEGSYNTATALNSVGIGLGIVGLAGAALGASMLVLRPSPSSASSARFEVSPARVALTGTF
jgi:hypothetical protein